MKSSSDTLEDAVKSVYLDPADLCIKSAFMSIRKAMLRLDMAKALHREAYKEELKNTNVYGARAVIGPYDTVFDLIKETAPQKLRKKLEAVIAEGFRRDPKHTLGSESPFKYGRIHIPERLLKVWKEVVEYDKR